MDMSKISDELGSDTYNSRNVSEAAAQLVTETKKMATCVFQDGKSKFTDAQSSLESYSAGLAVKVKEKPLASILVAGFVGYILSALVRD